MAMWNPWRGGHKYSEGCKFCYIHKGDIKKNITTDNIICQPLIEKINIEKYLDNVELVVVGGESDKNARHIDYDWVSSIREQCIRKNVHFEFRQCGTHFIKDGKEYTLKVKELSSQAKKANINY